LVRYPPLNLTVEVDEGAAFPNKLDDVDADGDQKDITLDITGPASLTFTNILDGTIKVKDVATVTVNGFKGHVEILDGVETYTSDKAVTLDIDSAADLETLTIAGALDPDTAADKSGPAIEFVDNNSIATITLSGKVGAVNLQGNGNLDTVTITAEIDGSLQIGATGAGNGNSDLATVTLTGAKATAVHVIQNFDLESVTIDNSFIAGSATGAKLDGTIKVIDNTSLTNLNISSDKVEYLEITGNDDLTTVDFTGLATAGATGSPEVYIYDNDIEASFEDEEDTESTKTADGEANDLGDVSSESGILTAYTYLAAVKADADSKISVLVDSVNFTTEGETTSEVLWAASTAVASQDTKLRIAYVVPNTADTGDGATTAKRSFVITNGSKFEAYVNDATVIAAAATVTLDDNNSVAISTQILTTAATTAATAAGVTMTAVDGGNPVAYIAIGPNSTASENSATGAVASIAGTTNPSDTLVLTVEGYSVTVTGSTNAGTVAVANALITAWVANYTTAATERYTITTPAGNGTYGQTTDHVIKFTAKDKGTGSLNKAVSLAFTAGKQSTDSNIGIVIGNDNSFTKSTVDNVTKGSDIVLTFESSTAGSILSEIGYFGKTQADVVKNVSLSGAAYTELSSTFSPNSSTSNPNVANTNIFPAQSRRNDVILPEELNAAEASNATDFSRIGWLN
jgi:hypothetical protein